MRSAARLLALLVLTGGATALTALAEEDAPWVAEVRGAHDRDLLVRLLSPDKTVRQGAAKTWDEERIAALPEYGPDNFPPHPVGALSDEVDPNDAFAVRKKAMMRALVAALEQGSVPQRTAAAWAIRELAPAYTSVIDALAEALGQPAAEVRLAAIDALVGVRSLSGGRYVETTIPALASCFVDDDARVRAAALDAVAGLCVPGHGDAAAGRREAPKMLAAARDEDARVRRAALSALGTVGRGAAEAIRAFVRGLEDPDASVRRAAAYALAREQKDGRSALDALRDRLADDAFDVRYAAAYAVWEIAHDSEGLLPVMLEALARFTGNDLALPARVICEIGPPAIEATPALIAACGRVKPARWIATGGEIVEALQSIGPPAESALPALEKVFAKGDANARREAFAVVGTLNGDPDRLAALVLEHLEGEEEAGARSMALSVLGDLRGQPEATLSVLCRTLSKGAWNEPRAAAIALGRWGEEAADAVPLLVGLLSAREEHVRRAATWALGRIATPPAVRALAERLADPPSRDAAFAALTEAGERAAPVYEAIAQRLADAPRQAALALGAMGKAARPALPTLRGLLRRSRGRTTVAVGEAMRRLGGPPDACVEALLAVLDNGEPEARREAAYALGRWGHAAGEALGRLERLREKGDFFDDGAAAALAAWQVGGDPGPALERLRKVVRNSTPPRARPSAAASRASGPAFGGRFAGFAPSRGRGLSGLFS